MRSSWFFPWWFLLLIAVGCAGSPGRRLLRQGDYATAITKLRIEVAEDDDDSGLHRDLGIALHQVGEHRLAVASLEEARRLDPEDARALFFLARSRDALGDVDGALDAYAAYLALDEQGRTEVRARIQALSLQKTRAEVRAAIAREQELSARDFPDNALAVNSFANVADSDSLAPLSYGLAALMITDLSKVEGLRVLERARLGVLLDELELSGAAAPAGTVPPEASAAPGAPQAREEAGRDSVGAAERAPERAPAATAPRIGLLLGAPRLVQGSFVPVGETGLQLDASIVQTMGGGRAVVGPPVTGELPQVLALQKRLVDQVLSTLGITPSAAEQREIDTLITEDWRAFLAFARGLWLEDQGRRREAAVFYRRAQAIDPAFELAAEHAAVCEVTAEAVERLTEAQLQPPSAGGVRPLRARLVRTGARGGLGSMPLVERHEMGRVSSAESERISAAGAEIVVSGNLPGSR